MYYVGIYIYIYICMLLCFRLYIGWFDTLLNVTYFIYTVAIPSNIVDEQPSKNNTSAGMELLK